MGRRVRVRYAPSPTGYLHIGGARTALFNYLFAKHYDGDFIVRIEDTDTKRNIKEGISSQLDNLRWLGVIPDETIDTENQNFAPYQQTKRLSIYHDYCNKLVESGKAYKCYCTIEELNHEREIQKEKGIMAPKYNRKCLNNPPRDRKEFTVRLKIPQSQKYSWTDMVRGFVEVDTNDVDDFVIMKNNSIPTYNFAVVVDDYLMQITHVLRGEEHITNTVKQLILFNYFGYTPPKFAHLTLIVDESKKKLSKRNSGELLQYVKEYKDMGYLPDALFNYLSLLGWSPGTEEEMFSVSKLIEIFDENKWSKSASTYDVKKVNWFNKIYMNKLTDDEYICFTMPFYNSKYKDRNKKNDWIRKMLLIFKPQLEYGFQIIELANLFFIEDIELSSEEKTFIQNQKSLITIKSFFDFLPNYKDKWEDVKIKNLITDVKKETKNKGKDLFWPIRLVASGQASGPELSKTLELLGYENVLKRFGDYKKCLKK